MLENREEAGELLAAKLKHYSGSEAIVLAIPKGGIPVGYSLAKNLNLPMDVILTKKIGYPEHPEFAVGAVSLESFFIDKEQEIPEDYIQSEVKRIRDVLWQKYHLY